MNFIMLLIGSILMLLGWEYRQSLKNEYPYSKKPTIWLDKSKEDVEPIKFKYGWSLFEKRYLLSTIIIGIGFLLNVTSPLF